MITTSKIYNYGQLHFLYTAYIAILSNSHTQYVPPKKRARRVTL